MTNPSKAKGTAAETAVVRHLVANGFPLAERRALHGSTDLGDITGTPGLVWEVKGGEAAKDASDNQILAWLAETDREIENANAAFGFLVAQRRQKNVRDWWVVMWAGDLANLMVGLDYHPGAPVRLTLDGLLLTLRVLGWTTQEAS